MRAAHDLALIGMISLSSAAFGTPAGAMDPSARKKINLKPFHHKGEARDAVRSKLRLLKQVDQIPPSLIEQTRHALERIKKAIKHPKTDVKDAMEGDGFIQAKEPNGTTIAVKVHRTAGAFELGGIEIREHPPNDGEKQTIIEGWQEPTEFVPMLRGKRIRVGAVRTNIMGERQVHTHFVAEAPNGPVVEIKTEIFGASAQQVSRIAHKFE